MLPALKKYDWAAVVLLVVAFAAILHAALPYIADTDSFYHIRHSAIYRESGIGQSAFPWAQYSVVNRYSADIWYGFHILLLPLTLLADLVKAIELGAFLTTVASLLAVYLAFRLLKLKWPLLWLAIFTVATADLLYRLAMLRPHPFSLALTLLLFALLHRHDIKRGLIFVFIVAAAFSWIHLALSWVPILTLLAVILFQLLQKAGLPRLTGFSKAGFDWQKITALFAGLAAGWLLRPNPLGAAKIAYVQVVQLLLEKQSELPLRFGRELLPFVWENFIDQLIPITILLLTALGYLAWLIKNKKLGAMPADTKAAAWSSLALCLIFLSLTFGVARRSNEFFIGFGVIFIGLLFTHYRSGHETLQRPASWQSALVMIIAAIALIYMPLKTWYRFESYAAGAFRPHRFQEVSGWLKNNSAPGEIIFNIHWDRFGQLFFWNPQNYYINGMDPIFQYAFDPALYWKTHFYAIDAGTAFTCEQVRCTAEETVSTYGVLKNDFRASYLVVEKRRSPNFYEYLSGAKEYQKVFEVEEEALFRIK